MNEINKKGLSTTLLCCLIWGLLPLYWALFKPSIILFRIIAPHHLVRILDVLPRHRYRAPTTAYGHTTFYVPILRN